MPEPWIPNRDRTRVTQNGSTVSGLDDSRFKSIGKLAHELGELKRHGELFSFEEIVLYDAVENLKAELTLLDQEQVDSAVKNYIAVAATRPEGSRICERDPHHVLAKVAEGKLYQVSGLAADLLKVCP